MDDLKYAEGYRDALIHVQQRVNSALISVPRDSVLLYLGIVFDGFDTEVAKLNKDLEKANSLGKFAKTLKRMGVING